MRPLRLAVLNCAASTAKRVKYRVIGVQPHSESPKYDSHQEPNDLRFHVSHRLSSVLRKLWNNHRGSINGVVLDGEQSFIRLIEGKRGDLRAQTDLGRNL
jgi:hypothetical protein